MKIALYVPSWPPGFSPNGIVTYASYLVPALRQLGHEVFVLTFAAGECDDPYCIELRRFSPVHNLLNRALFRFAPETAHFNSISFAIANAIRELVAKHQIDVFEIEEVIWLELCDNPPQSCPGRSKASWTMLLDRNF